MPIHVDWAGQHFLPAVRQPTVFEELSTSAQSDWKKKGQSWMNSAQTKLTSFCWLLTTAAGLFVVVFHLGHSGSFRASDEMLHAEHVVSEAAHMLAVRGECNETASALALASATDGITALGLAGSITASGVAADGTQVATAASAETTSEAIGESVPVSTQTSLSTIYSIKSTAGARTMTSTTTGTITITLLPVPEYTHSAEDACHETVTETVLVTVYPHSDATVTAEASTVTDVNTQFTYSSGPPDLTLSGSPSTYTAVQTDVSFTPGAPDATVPGNPSTVTNVQTDVSVTPGLPDATISGEPSTVTDIQISWNGGLTTTWSTPFTTITITDLWDATSPSPASQPTEPISLSTFTTILSSPSSAAEASSQVAGDVTTLPANPTSTYTAIVTATGGPPAVETTTIDVLPPPAYTNPPYNSSSAEDTNAPASSPSTSTYTPIVISGGSKRPEPKAWAGSNGSSHIACTVMLIAIITLIL
ncbi:hypothetical protein E4U42_007947 [Claviceps africana]|uniref:Uncharacterized protein n=1 Tax=Claviceps africana TaxID=83212 RepID=A0A8K0JAF6_9HYPO|nr:hypothetical protein E4U42_007947 [Claviceps africana]